MKRLATIFFVCLLAACRKHGPEVAHRTEITIVHDVTDSMIEMPQIGPVLALYDFQDDKDQSAVFRYVLITDKNLNAVSENSIDNSFVTEKMNLNDEVNYRERVIRSFYVDVSNSVQNFQKEFAINSPLGHSECYSTVACEVARLATSKASQRILIVYGDMQENSCLFNCYSAKSQELLVGNPTKVEKMFQRGLKFPDNLQGITVYFVYRPTDRESDMRYGRIIAIYKHLLHERGARVVIQATAKHFEA